MNNGLAAWRSEADSGEYWDGDGSPGLKYLIEAGKTLLTGERPAVGDDPKGHARVAL